MSSALAEKLLLKLIFPSIVSNIHILANFNYKPLYDINGKSGVIISASGAEIRNLYWDCKVILWTCIIKSLTHQQE